MYFRRRQVRPAQVEPLERRRLLASSPPLAPYVQSNPQPARQMELLNRGLVALRTSSTNVFLSWRLLGTDPSNVGFNIYRSTNGATAVKLNSSVLTAGTNYSYSET